jgi:hypothetical protein
VIGGYQNTADGSYSLVSGGQANEVTGWSAVSSGGHNNIAGGSWSITTGGEWNTTVANYAVITGGNNSSVTVSGEALFDACNTVHNVASCSYSP